MYNDPLHRLPLSGHSQLFSPRQSRSTNVATFLALLELVRGGRVTLGENGELTMQRTRIKEKK